MTASATGFARGAQVFYPQGYKGKTVLVPAIYQETLGDGNSELELSAEDAEKYNGGDLSIYVPESNVLPYVSAEPPAPEKPAAPIGVPVAAPVRDADDDVLGFLSILSERGDNIFTISATPDFTVKTDDARTSLDKAYIQQLRADNATRNVYVSMNPLMPGEKRRQKDKFGVARNVFMEVDENGDAVLAMVRADAAAGKIPYPTTILQSSPGKFQFAWRVNSSDFTKAKVEDVNRALVARYGGDPASTDALRLLRLPTFINRKYEDEPVCTLVEARDIDRRYTFADFQIPIEESKAVVSKPTASDGEIAKNVVYFEEAATAASLNIKLFKKHGPQGFQYEVTCPWRNEHTKQIDSGSVVYINGSGAFGFHCAHGHCAERKWKEFRAKLAEMAGVAWQCFGDTGPEVVLNSTPSAQQAPAGQAWGDPRPLLTGLLPVPPFELGFLPTGMQAWAKDVSERMSVPLDFVGISVLCALAGCTNRRAFVYPKQHDKSWKEAISISGAVIAHSGRKKTPTWKTMTGPMYEIEVKWHDEYKARWASYEAELKRYEESEKQRAKDAKKDQSDAGELYNSTKPAPALAVPLKPAPRRRLIINDSTPETMHQIMSDNPEGLFVYRDEMSGWIAELDVKGRESERSMMLAAMNGNDPHTLDRIGRGNLHSLMSASLFGGFQPEPLIDFLCDTRNTSEGLVARFGLLVWPDRDLLPQEDRAMDETAQRGFRHALQVLSNAREESVCLWFSPEAQAIYKEWCAALYLRVENEQNESKRSHISKHDGLLARLAGLLQLVDLVSVVATLEGGTYLIDEDHLRRAIALLGYLERHASRIYACIKSPEQLATGALAKRIESQELREPFSARDIQRCHWRNLGKLYIEDAIADLEDLDWIRSLPSSGNGKGGRPSIRYAINPKLKSPKLKGKL